ncbi:MAG: beta-propeller domain-containing protein [Nanoarchaeota archaeon]
MNDKFIMMNIDDERSKKVAEVLKSDTCKKILDYLAENKEKSEEDIAKNLKMPINTVEYNLKKLVESGLVERAKNFFWSKKGKKINLYKPANRHIVISPKKKPDMNILKTILPVIIAIVAIIALVLLLSPETQEQQGDLNKFSSLNELNKFLKDNQVESGRGGILDIFKAATSPSMAGTESDSGSNQGADEYSSTNIQVEGVDEADVIKNDGKYIYAVSGNKVVIVDAFPASNMKVLSEINLSGSVGEIFVNKDKLIVFSQEYSQIVYGRERCMEIGCITPPNQDEAKTGVYIYDISNRQNPTLDENISLTGNYVSSRMINNYVYLIANQYAYQEGVLPAYEKNGQVKVVKADEVYYSPIKDQSFQFTNILAININNGETSEKTVLTGSSQTIYVSKNNIYTTYTKYAYYWNSGSTDQEKTIINKFSIDKSQVEFLSSGEVPGHLLNQFSMDENKDYFRIATTIGEVWNSEKPSTNNIYVLDKDMKLIGSLEDLAPGEKIYSSRFIGDRAYLVTFKKIDPLFVISLENPTNPTVLGKLKIPGYSDYLHPYDENHIIGIGKEAIDASEEETTGRQLDFAWYQGIKIAIFDVSDVNNPIEEYKEVIGDRGTDSEALQNHKAFLFDREKELLVLPINLAEIKGEKTQDNQYGEFTFQGAYVYKINLEDGFKLQGRITHYNETDYAKMGYYFYGDKSISRSLYMDDTLYTFSPSMIKANDLDNLEEISSLNLPYNKQSRYY